MPEKKDTASVIRDILTIYKAAMVYAGRDPYPDFFALKNNSSVDDHLQILKLGLSNKLPSKRLYTQTDRRIRTRADRRVRAQAHCSWDICCELLTRIEHGRIQPIKTAYTSQGKIDLRRTLIKTSDLVRLAQDRGEKPRYLRRLLEPTVPARTATKMAPVMSAASRLDMQAVEEEYEQHVKSFQRAHQGRYPSRQQDLEWGKEKILKRDHVTELRKKFIPAKVRKGGRPKSRKPDEK